MTCTIDAASTPIDLLDPDTARRRWVIAVFEGRFGTAAYLEPLLPPVQVSDGHRNSSAASGTRTPVSISGSVL